MPADPDPTLAVRDSHPADRPPITCQDLWAKLMVLVETGFADAPVYGYTPRQGAPVGDVEAVDSFVRGKEIWLT